MRINNDMLEVGISAPDFELPDQNGKLHRLSDYKGKNVLVYFYPKDDTPGCTTEACTIRDQYDAFTKSKLIVLGISHDTPASHKKFIAKYSLPFTLLSDPKKEVISAYGAGGIFTKRISYLIGPDGKITKSYAKVIPQEHAQAVLSTHAALAKARA